MLTEHTTSYHNLYCLTAADTSSSCSSSTTIHPISNGTTNIIASQSSLTAARTAPLSFNVLLSHVDPPPQLSHFNNSMPVPMSFPSYVTPSNWTPSGLPLPWNPSLVNTEQTPGDPFSLEDYLSPQEYFDGSVLEENLFELPQPQASGVSSVLPVASSTCPNLHWPQQNNLDHNCRYAHFSNSMPVPISFPMDVTPSNWTPSGLPLPWNPSLVNTEQTPGDLFSLEDYLSPQEYFDGSVLEENLFELPQPQASGVSSVLPVASSTCPDLHWPQENNLDYNCTHASFEHSLESTHKQ